MPSGDQSKSSTPPLTSVIFSASPPARGEEPELGHVVVVAAVREEREETPVRAPARVRLRLLAGGQARPSPCRPSSSSRCASRACPPRRPSCGPRRRPGCRRARGRGPTRRRTRARSSRLNGRGEGAAARPEAAKKPSPTESDACLFSSSFEFRPRLPDAQPARASGERNHAALMSRCDSRLRPRAPREVLRQRFAKGADRAARQPLVLAGVEDRVRRPARRPRQRVGGRRPRPPRRLEPARQTISRANSFQETSPRLAKW